MIAMWSPTGSAVPGACWPSTTVTIENRVKEVKLDLRMDKTSGTGFAAHPFRVLLSLAAARRRQAFQEKRTVGTEFAGAPMGTLRERLFKRAVRVRESARRDRPAVQPALSPGGGVEQNRFGARRRRWRAERTERFPEHFS